MGVLLGACALVRGRAGDLPHDEARAYLAAWAAGDLAAMRRALAEPPGTFEAQQARFAEALRIESSRLELRDVVREGPDVVARFRAVHVLRGLGEWEVEGALPFVRRDERWRVRWTPAVLHPEARAGDRFSRTRSRPERADILDAQGRPLTHPGEVIAVGVEPRRVRSRAEVAEALRTHLGVDPARLERALEAPGVEPGRFLSLVEVRPERYRRVRPALAPVPGIVFRRRRARLSPAEGWAAHTLGRVGEVTPELLETLGVAYQVGDTVGRSGLELAHERQLAGAPSGEVRLTRASGEVRVLQRFAGEAGRPLRTTLRPALQAAAEAALEGVGAPAALVAVESATGAVVAVASRPLEEALHRALVGRYPPGSTFKVVTAEALLARGLGPDTPVSCPPEASAGGRRFRNFEGETLGATTLRAAFAHSCNTTFVTLAARLSTGALVDAARRFGFDVGGDAVGYDAGLPSAGATFPGPRDAAERAAAAIGQGRVLSSPLHLASVAAAAASGVWRAPHLLAGAPDVPGEALSEGAASALREMMCAAVAQGTGRQAAHVEGLCGKTGTAEFGSAEPPATHAWFIGFRRGVAFAVLVEGGGVGGRVAAPIAARFAAAL